MDFVRKLGSGEEVLKNEEDKGRSVNSDWASEFAGERVRREGVEREGVKSEGEEVKDGGFWGQLEKEWEDLAK